MLVLALLLVVNLVMHPHSAQSGLNLEENQADASVISVEGNSALSHEELHTATQANAQPRSAGIESSSTAHVAIQADSSGSPLSASRPQAALMAPASRRAIVSSFPSD